MSASATVAERWRECQPAQEVFISLVDMDDGDETPIASCPVHILPLVSR
ncbi:MAG: hypothetical protein QOF36_2078, partial [Microbacteriaceae bacterium]|nr:hypothetical protein [Microbacteriaceae bacterium]